MDRSNAGFTLIEALVALAVLSIGLLGLAMLQVQGMKFTTESYFRTQATLLAYDIMDRMRANEAGTLAGNYGTQSSPITAAPSVETCGNVGSTCSSTAALARYDLSQWYQMQAALLPPAAVPSGITRDDATNTYTITMRWNERGTPLKQEWTLTIRPWPTP